MITDYHAKLFAHELLRRHPSDSVERFTATLMGSQVDLNPHQVDAALFAFRSPLSKGAILADEVGLGKTIETGIALSQKWAERKRKILVILPSSLRKQWSQEMMDKFYLPSSILESKSFNQAIKAGQRNPFEREDIVICSYYFARNKASYLKAIQWDLVVIDEAHRLRNVYKSGNKIARELRDALSHAPKLLLTATPLQNSLMELYGLVSFIDEHTFGDLKSFRSQFSRLTGEDNFIDLKERLKPVCKRTLRKQVLEYIRYTERKAYTQEFVPSDEEDALYDLVSDYLRKPNLQALPASQRTLMTLVLRKLLASSSFAIAGALNSLASKLERKLAEDEKLSKVADDIEDDFETYSELSEQLSDEEDKEPYEALTEPQKEAIRHEIVELRYFYELAMDISENAKGESLIHALRKGFQMAQDLGGNEKAVIFTESRRTQDYLVELLSQNGWENDLLLFNGSNNDQRSKDIYARWKLKYEGTDKISGSKTADMRAALVEHFQDEAKILIATEAAAEGINLQFCSLVVNYDLPWNPQRIEQRIGRCHRYGQQHDVVVVNFLNKNNAADQRVYQLLSEKFKLFDGVFGASDEVLGRIESGIDFEKRIVEIYQSCREKEEIQTSFDQLQFEMSEEIDANLRSTRQKLLENFDAEVAEKLNVFKEEANQSLSKYEFLLWETTHHLLHNEAHFNSSELSFTLNQSPAEQIPLGNYLLKYKGESGHHYHLQNPLAKWILKKATNLSSPATELVFDLSNASKNISILEPFIGESGTLSVDLLTVTSLESEDYIIISAKTDSGKELDSEQSRRLFDLEAETTDGVEIEGETLQSLYESNKKQVLGVISERNATFFEEEMEKLDRWAEDQKRSLEIRIKDLDAELKQLKAVARKIAKLEEKISQQRKIKDIDKKRTDLRRKLFDAQDEIDRQKDELLDEVEKRLEQSMEERNLFTIRWSLS